MFQLKHKAREVRPRYQFQLCHEGWCAWGSYFTSPKIHFPELENENNNSLIWIISSDEISCGTKTWHIVGTRLKTNSPPSIFLFCK